METNGTISGMEILEDEISEHAIKIQSKSTKANVGNYILRNDYRKQSMVHLFLLIIIAKTFLWWN